MFRKPFKVKSNSLIKGSDRKKLRSHLSAQFPQLIADELNRLVSNKDEMFQLKLIAHNGSHIIVYISNGSPIFFEAEDTVFPTVYTLWTYPDLLPSFSTWGPIFEKLSGGADLMLPGVIQEEIEPRLECVVKGQICSVNLSGNKASVAVGKSALNGIDLHSEERKGKAVLLTHLYGDLLWAMGPKTEPPIIEPVDETNPQIDQQLEELQNLDIEEGEQEENPVEPTVVENEINMDELLMKCLLTAIKTTMKKAPLPLLVSNFHRLHLIACCPIGQTLNVKKSTYKKLSTFLKEMETQGVLQVKELTKGVESIVHVNFMHENVQRFRVDKSEIQQIEPQVKQETKNEYTPPLVRELFVVSAAVLPFFSQLKISKGTAFSASDVRRVLTDYVKQEELQRLPNKGLVTLDPILAHVMLAKGEYLEVLTWEELQTRCLAKMSPAYEIVFADKTTVFKKGQLAPIEIKTAQRSGNKKVTLIYNLEHYGIDPEKFAHQVQVAVAASTSVTNAPSTKSMQVLIQGNQIKYVGKLLIEDYQIPRKYVNGLDKHTGGGAKKK